MPASGGGLGKRMLYQYTALLQDDCMQLWQKDTHCNAIRFSYADSGPNPNSLIAIRIGFPGKD
jgi:hypothetical protein